MCMCSLPPRVTGRRSRPQSRAAALLLVSIPLIWIQVVCGAPALAGGPRFVAGVGYFDPAVKGHPIVWKNGQVSYYTDQGDLSSSVTNATGNATVAAAAAFWNAVPTAGVAIAAAGTLDEDVSGTNVTASLQGVSLPADTESLAKPVAIVYDADGAVMDSLLGVGASDPITCWRSGVMVQVDKLATDGTIAHALVLVNGRCVGSSTAELQELQYRLIRAFGQILGLDWSQANDAMYMGVRPWTDAGFEGWPVMHPLDLRCGNVSWECITNPFALRTDDVAALNRLYPVTAANVGQFVGKQITARSTVAIHGVVRFRQGQPMQGVNVIAQPLMPGTNIPDIRYPAASVSGFAFRGDAGPSHPSETSGVAVGSLGSDDVELEGAYDLSGMPLPPGATAADYQITLEPINGLYRDSESVGPYSVGSPTPSGTMPTAIVHGLTAGATVQQDFTIGDSADDTNSGGDGSETNPASLPQDGEWTGRISPYGHESWFQFPVRAGRQLTIEAQSLDESGEITLDKAQVVLGLWSAFDPPGSAPELSTPVALNGFIPGETYLSLQTLADGEARLRVADERGDGRPDYAYRGRLLYADTVTPSRLPLSGGLITIRGRGFRPGMTVSFGNVTALITEITPTQIVAMAPPAQAPSGSLTLLVADPQTLGTASIGNGISYDAGTYDLLTVLKQPDGSLSAGTPATFAVRALAPDGTTPLEGVTVLFTVAAGSAGYSACGGAATCSVTTEADGSASVQVTATAQGYTRLAAATLPNGSMVSVTFTSTAPASTTALSGTIYLAAGATYTWNPLVLMRAGAQPNAGALVFWSGVAGAMPAASRTFADASGIATVAIAAGPLVGGAIATAQACGLDLSACATFNVIGIHPEVEALLPVSGVSQELFAGQSTAAVVFRVVNAIGDPVIGAVVSIYETLRQWTPACEPHVTCPAAPVLASTVVQRTSDGQGLVVLQPLARTDVPTQLTGIAIAGTAGTASFSIDQHP